MKCIFLSLTTFALFACKFVFNRRISFFFSQNSGNMLIGCKDWLTTNWCDSFVQCRLQIASKSLSDGKWHQKTYFPTICYFHGGHVVVPLSWEIQNQWNILDKTCNISQDSLTSDAEQFLKLNLLVQTLRWQIKASSSFHFNISLKLSSRFLTTWKRYFLPSRDIKRQQMHVFTQKITFGSFIFGPDLEE